MNRYFFIVGDFHPSNSLPVFTGALTLNRTRRQSNSGNGIQKMVSAISPKIEMVAMLG